MNEYYQRLVFSERKRSVAEKSSGIRACHRSSLIGRGTPANHIEQVCHCQDLEVHQHSHKPTIPMFQQDDYSYLMSGECMCTGLSTLYLVDITTVSTADSTSDTISTSVRPKSPLRTWPNDTHLLRGMLPFKVLQCRPRNYNALHSLKRLNQVHEPGVDFLLIGLRRNDPVRLGAFLTKHQL